ncbi:hydantoinase/oxoprolinase family protein [Rhodobacter sp. NTK016B]|uniref:hydantoinase/oxoprolinase family protein n=1 Tax=Rhodobacter sp. NTK016B TaxID=2759676 RepID=UPI001A8F1748|nr:hydantoinase/oxoprolinase family protein [Rhodobacter sp. NTK016B]MBN8290638.1 hydantoinase/oxoprolinase family protein [Rhodobacter sp. NTK016B]
MTDIRIGIDVGGTFTDFALATPGGLTTLKLPTTPRAPERAILDGVAQILSRAGIAPGQVTGIVHGTTLATNAIIARKGARTAMITTQGFRDVLAMGDEGRFDQYDITIVKPEPLIPRWWRFPVPERMASDGAVLLPLDEEGLRDLAATLKAERIESVALCFLHAHVNPDHERRALDILQPLLPGVLFSLSSDVSPEIGEYARFSTTAANAFVQPQVARYLDRLEVGLATLGLFAPVFMFLSNGGLCHLDTARRYPIRLVESGPAGGAVFAAHLARTLDEREILAFDMGGTTAKVCLIENGVPRRSPSFEMAREHMHRQGSGLPARIPVIDLVEIGAGGGSIARVDAQRRLQVGPDSAGADPGPACYARGGTDAAVTDANLQLGRLSPGDFDGSGIVIDPALATQALEAGVGRPLGLGPQGAAAALAEVVEEQMAGAAREHAREKGVDLRARAMIAFGGGGGIHAARIARKLGVSRIIVPQGAGIGSAIGFLQAEAVFELSRTVSMPLARFDAALYNRLYAEMASEAGAFVEAASPGTPQRAQRTLFMRYKGQGQTLQIDVEDRDLQEADASALHSLFQRHYASLYKRALDRIPVEIVALSLRVAAQDGGGRQIAVIDPLERDLPPEAPLYDLDTDAMVPAAQILRSQLGAAPLPGPALIKDKGTTIHVPRGFDARVIAGGHVLLTDTMQETAQ